MPESSFQQARKAVAIACAATTTFVKITKVNPLRATPVDLFERRFKEIGIISDAQITAFRQTLIRILPDPLTQDLNAMDVSVEIVTGLVVDHVEALLLALHASNNN